MSAVIAVVVVTALALLARRANNALVAAAAAMTGPQVPAELADGYRAAATAGRSRGRRLVMLLAGLLALSVVTATVVTWLVEPEALVVFAWAAGLLAVLPALVLTAMLATLLPPAMAMRAGLMFLRPVTDGPGAEAAGNARGALQGLTPGTVGVLGVGITASILSVLLGVGVIGALFMLASSSIACARDPKCI